MNRKILGKQFRRAATMTVLALGWFVVAVLTAAPAQALPGMIRITATSSHDTAATKTVDANCPAGTVPLGGGGVVDPAQPDDVKIRATGVHLTDTGSYYAVTADVASDPRLVGPWDLTVTAVCAPKPPGYEIRISYSPFTPGTAKPLFTTCSAGKQVLSAGGYVYRVGGVAAPELTLNGFTFSENNAASLTAQTWRYGFTGNWMDELDLVCADRLPGYAEVQRTSTVTGNTADHTEHTVSSRACPPGTSAIGLGAAVGTVGQHVQPLAINLEQNSAAVAGAADTEGEATNWSITAQAICAN